MLELISNSRADFIVNFVIICSLLLPFFMIASFKLAKNKKFEAHKKTQIALFIFGTFLVILLEIDIRFFNLNENIEQSIYYQTSYLKTVFIIHLIFAFSSYILWIYILIKSLKQYPKFKFNHKLYGIILFCDLIMTSITGIWLYIMLFWL